MKTYGILATAAAAMLATSPALAAGQAYLPAERAVAILADGAPWNAEAPGGRSFKLTLNKDGSGKIRGPLLFSMAVNWTVEGDAMCLTSRMVAKCLRFSETPGGLQAFEGDKPDLKISR